MSLSPSNPFSFTIHSTVNEPMWLCWTGPRKQAWDWGEDSRLERQTEHGTWEIMPHTLDLCKDSTESGIRIPPGKSVTVDGTTAYPSSNPLPPGIYRWVLTLNPINGLGYLIFSPRFVWDGQQ